MSFNFDKFYLTCGETSTNLWSWGDGYQIWFSISYVLLFLMFWDRTTWSHDPIILVVLNLSLAILGSFYQITKISTCMAAAFLFHQVKDLGVDGTEESKKEQQRQTKMMMLMSWLPLLCRASNGTDVPVLSIRERAELERVLEETIELLEQQEQEQVFSLWLHHFTHCPSSDWPNLHRSYTRWCNASRRLLVLQWQIFTA